MTTDTIQHTPGPWKVYHEDTVTERFAIQTNEQFPDTIADLRMHSKDILPAEANARLIAAAPDLLAALEAISTLAHQYADARGTLSPRPYVNARWLVTTADAAIRKARGE